MGLRAVQSCKSSRVGAEVGWTVVVTLERFLERRLTRVVWSTTFLALSLGDLSSKANSSGKM
eukprot:2119313-Amphidinium_carterae.1